MTNANLKNIRRKLEKEVKVPISKKDWDIAKDLLLSGEVGECSSNKGRIIYQLCKRITEEKENFAVIQDGKDSKYSFDELKKALFIFCRDGKEEEPIWDVYLYSPENA